MWDCLLCDYFLKFGMKQLRRKAIETFPVLVGSLGSSWYHAGIRSSWLCFITNQGSDYLAIILPPSSLMARVNTTSVCKLWVWPSTFATRDENSAPPSALPGVISVPLGWFKKGMSWAKSSDAAQCQLMDELFLSQMSQKTTLGEGGCFRAPAVLLKLFFLWHLARDCCFEL